MGTINFILTLGSYLLSVSTGRVFITGLPPAIGIEISARCNLMCPECPAGSGKLMRKQGFMELRLFEKIIDELRPFLFNINLYFQGEPMLHPDFFRFASIARGLRLTVSTNGHFLTDENIEKLVASGIRKIIISLDGLDQETYSAYRKGGDVNRVIDGIRKLSIAVKKRKTVLAPEIQCLVNRVNEHQIPEIKRFASETGMKLSLKSMQIITSEGFDKWLPSEGKYSRYFSNGNGHRLKSRMKSRCLRLWMNPVITYDGNVIPCCFDKDAMHVLGNLNELSFREIWKGEKNYQFRKKFLSDREGIAICRNCTSGLKGVIV